MPSLCHAITMSYHHYVIPENNNYWTLTASHHHQALPDHQRRRYNHTKVQNLVVKLKQAVLIISNMYTKLYYYKQLYIYIYYNIIYFCKLFYCSLAIVLVLEAKVDSCRATANVNEKERKAILRKIC